jgi:hypothetical protein
MRLQIQKPIITDKMREYGREKLELRCACTAGYQSLGPMENIKMFFVTSACAASQGFERMHSTLSHRVKTWAPGGRRSGPGVVLPILFQACTNARRPLSANTLLMISKNHNPQVLSKVKAISIYTCSVCVCMREMDWRCRASHSGEILWRAYVACVPRLW